MEQLKHFLNNHIRELTQLLLIATYVIIVATIIVSRGKTGDNWSDDVFFAELVGLVLINLIVIVFRKFIPNVKKAITPWLYTLLAAALLILFVAKVMDPAYYFGIGDLFTNLPSESYPHLGFFGYLDESSMGYSTRAALLDAQLALLAGYGLGIVMQNTNIRALRDKL